MHALGTDDSINTCECCGKSGLKFTVTVQLDNGEIAHYGSTCATRNTGKTAKTIAQEIRKEYADRVERARAQFRASVEYGQHCAKLSERARLAVPIGRESADFVRDTANACARKAEVIALEFKVSTFDVRG